MASRELRWAMVFATLLYGSLLLIMVISTHLGGQHLPPGASIFYGENGFGAAARSLMEQHRWGFIDKTYGLWCYACRMPVIPALEAASSRLSGKLSDFVLLKNLLFWPLWMVAFLRLKRHYRVADEWALATAGLLLLTPYNLNIAGWVDVEEGFLFALIALSFSLLLTMEGPLTAAMLGLCMAAIYLTKSSMFLLCFVLSAWIVIRDRRRPVIAAIPLLCMSLAVFGWGLSMRAVSGVFAFGQDTSSWNGWNFYKGNNPWADSLYPRVSLDDLDDEPRTHGLLPFEPIHTEWELSHAQFALARAYMRQHPVAIVRMDFKKLFVACCDLKESPEKTAGHTRPAIVISNLVSHLTLAAVLLLTLGNVLRRRAGEAELLAVALALAYVLPYFAGFLYMRHMVPIYGLMDITFGLQLARWRIAADGV